MQTQFLKPFKGLAPVSHPFSTGLKKEILVLCGPKHVDTALQCGARVAGGVDLVAKIKVRTIEKVIIFNIGSNLKKFVS